MKTPGATSRPLRSGPRLERLGTPRLGSRGRPEESRAAILKAAVAEFAENGIAGARTDAIARAAHVNKALLYYYFKDKDALYEAVLDHVFSGLAGAGDAGARKRTAAAGEDAGISGAYFDYIAANPQFPRVVQAEWMRAGAKSSVHMQRRCAGTLPSDLWEAGRGVAGGD